MDEACKGWRRETVHVGFSRGDEKRLILSDGFQTLSGLRGKLER